MNSDIALLIMGLGVALVFQLMFSLPILVFITRVRGINQAQYATFFQARYGGSLDRMLAESPVDRRLLLEWCAQGPRGIKRAHKYVELWDPVPDAVIDAFLRRLRTDPS